MKSKKVRILIVDDHAMMREGLKRILDEVAEMEVAGEAANGCDALRLMREEHWDLVLMDIALPDKNGLDVLKQIKTEKPDLPILILSMYPEDQYAVRVLKAGASGYLTKESAPDQLINAIRTVARGESYISTRAAQKMATELKSKFAAFPHEMLSDREFEILCHIASGKTPTQIAADLHLSVKTIGTYRSRILQKMNMQNNAELTHYAVKNGLVA